MHRFYKIAFVKAATPVTKHVTKFGGQPVWWSTPTWPLSLKTGQPMHFLGQVYLDPLLFGEIKGSMAYLFMTDDPDGSLATMDPTGMENAVIVQPAEYRGKTLPLATGPVWETERVRLFSSSVRPVEFDTSLTIDSEQIADDKGFSNTEATLGNKIGGIPSWIYEPDLPQGGPWTLLLQLESSAPIHLGLGDAGTLYAMMNAVGEGIMLWQTN